jgi:CHAT domain-containing protein
VPSCSRQKAPQAEYDRAYAHLVQGQLAECRNEATRGSRQFLNANPGWAMRFRILEARALLEQGHFDDAVRLLDDHRLDDRQIEDHSSHLDTPDLAVSAMAVAAVARIHLHRLAEAQQILDQGLQQCNSSEVPSCGDLFQALGILAGERSDLPAAEKLFSRSLSFARSHGDSFLESSSLLNLGYQSLAQERFDETADRSEAAYRAAQSIGARVIALVAQGNIGWAYYRLGDPERALTLSLEAEKTASQLDDVFDRENLLTNLGYIYMDERKFDLAAQSFQHALELSKSINAKQDIYNALRVLARLALQTGDPNKANDYADKALDIARESGNHLDELYPLLVRAQVEALRGDATNARRTFDKIEHDQTSPVSLKWEAQHSLAQLYETQKDSNLADREYRAALATFESARSSVRGEDFQLSFLTNAARIYDDYVHFLVAQGKPEQALRWADYSRARTLSEGLGLLSNEPASANSRHNQLKPPLLDGRSIAKRARGTLLFYWLGETQSYLWAITTQKSRLFLLPPRAEIEAAVRHYRTLLNGPQDALQSGEDSRALYGMLIAPAQSLLGDDAKVFILPDGGLNNLNFETLVVPSPKPHYWIEDADVVNASSLRVLAASLVRRETGSRRLMLIGDSVAVSNDYPELPRAADQMASVAKNFAASEQRVYQHELATPAAYLQNHPEQFSHIHFVAHGTASRLSPLDSAIVLSREAANPNSVNPNSANRDSAQPDSSNPDSFKLYARDIIHHHLRADLVTISACYGAGERQYSGEGLVGLAWAFQRAGARNVIAALWEVTDASTDQLMSRFYQELAKGAAPDVALRTAKLALLRGSSFHNPFYWAPFQLYTG